MANEDDIYNFFNLGDGERPKKNVLSFITITKNKRKGPKRKMKKNFISYPYPRTPWGSPLVINYLGRMHGDKDYIILN